MNKIKIIGNENPVYTRAVLVDDESGEELGDLPISAVTWEFDLNREPATWALLRVEFAELIDGELIIDTTAPGNVEVMAVKAVKIKDAR